VNPSRKNWPYLKTPVGVYLVVMLPICGLEVFLLVTDCPNWMRWSAGAVVALTVWGFVRGYLQRLVIEEGGVRLRRLGRDLYIPWERVHRVDVYVPGGGVGATEYLYVTTREAPPQGKWDIDEETIQIQDQAGVLEALQAARTRSMVQSLPA
jgi:hypothetical protein